jgi:uncharacterized membrane protein
MSRAIEPGSPTRRLPILDAARGLALLAMASYHFIWDLELFGYLAAGTATAGALKWYARGIAASFLVIVGFSLALAATPDLNHRSFWIRLGKVVAAAGIISAATLFLFPDGFIYFGILHHIALASVVGLAFLRPPVAFVVLAAMAAFSLSRLGWFETHSPVLAFLGLDPSPPPSNDFVPVFPWLGWSLIGIASARLWLKSSRTKPGTVEPKLPVTRFLGWLGRRSLAFYLIHQPILIGLVWLCTQIAPPSPSIAFGWQCRAACGHSFDAAACDLYCNCMVDRLHDAGLNLSVIDTTDTVVQAAVRVCSQAMSTPPP